MASIVNTSEFSQAAWSLFNEIRKKDASTAGHSLRVAEYTENYLRSQGYDEERVQEGFYAGLLHDAGKILIPDEILKSTEEYSKEQRDIMNKHSEYGPNTLTGVLKDCQFIKDGMVHHHTSYNPDPARGGLPGGHLSELEGKDIPEMGRIIAIADIYDALSHARTYKTEIKQKRVYEMLEDDPRLDPELKEKFIPFIKDYIERKQAIEEIQAQTIIFDFDEVPDQSKAKHILDDTIGQELRKQIDIFVNAQDKLKYITPTQDEVAVMQWNTALREIVRNMPRAHDQQGNKYDATPACDETGKITKIKYYSEENGTQIGSYVITNEDAIKTVGGIAEGITKGSAEQSKETTQEGGKTAARPSKRASTDDIEQ